MNAAGIIFSNLHDRHVPELTRTRTMASVPFACRYRFIDFALSNMVNSGISNISVITHNNYRSLMEHIGSGKDWDLARRSGGIKLLPPFITAHANVHNELYSSRLDALKSVAYSISELKEDYVVLSDCDLICNIDLTDVLHDHIEHGADITMVVKRLPVITADEKSRIIYEADADGRITDCITQPEAGLRDKDISLNIWVVTRTYLQSAVQDAIAHGYTSFTYDIIAKNAARRNFRIYRYGGNYADIYSLAGYFKESMALLADHERWDALFNVENRPILTRVHNSPPTKYAAGAQVSNSMIADGCRIEGRVENSIIFRGVRVGPHAVVKNSILFQNTYVGEGADLNCVIADKSVIIRDRVRLCGHPELPFYIDKSTML
ncbi:MAG: glucose-1-phosphate adenylyltransferase subunit GlgD [Clostridia bacterium]|nr:glucose-1-phosphate adenylyltransferase subunit GlgD [Clostridia bacterium]